MKVYFRAVRGTAVYDRLIAWYSRSPYTHAEFHWPLTAREPKTFFGAQPGGGVAVRPADYLDKASNGWTCFSVNLEHKQVVSLRSWLESQRGLPYDFRAIANMLVPLGRSRKRWFCSELVYFALASVGLALLRVPEKQSDTITPRDLSVSTIAKLEYMRP